MRVSNVFSWRPQLADGLAQGRVAFLPMQMRAVYDYIAGQAFDVVLLQAAYDHEGRLRLGPNVDFAAAAMARARALVAEVNDAIVAPAGCPLMPESRFDALVRTRRCSDPVRQRQTGRRGARRSRRTLRR